ncbi:hypothetical protein RF644_10575 [Kocuria sp. CPCC 205258]|jgi:hypothetical protein|uniref:hypothetical protein n=1 Tax=Kocuria sp. CPCC 205258 TaxID=3073552 RepID=UPI0034D6DC54
MSDDECPDCEYGTVARYRVQATGALVHVCDECDALWEDGDDRTEPSATTVDQYLNLRGLPLLWSGLVSAV